jgi:hypothetical protein
VTILSVGSWLYYGDKLFVEGGLLLV